MSPLLQPVPSAWLALDTATAVTCVAAGQGARTSVRVAEGGAQASVSLLPTARDALAELGLQWRDLSAVAYTQGPGAFTGLRTSCAVAQGLGLGLAVPLWPLDSLMLVAEDARAVLPVPEGAEVWAAMDARIEQVYAACYRWHHGAWRTVQAPQLLDIPALQQRWDAQPPACVAGSALEAYPVLQPGAARCLKRPHAREAALARLARAGLAAGPGLDPADALPLYLRDKVASTTAERAAAA